MHLKIAWLVRCTTSLGVSLRGCAHCHHVHQCTPPLSVCLSLSVRLSVCLSDLLEGLTKSGPSFLSCSDMHTGLPPIRGAKRRVPCPTPRKFAQTSNPLPGLLESHVLARQTMFLPQHICKAFGTAQPGFLPSTAVPSFLSEFSLCTKSCCVLLSPFTFNCTRLCVFLVEFRKDCLVHLFVTLQLTRSDSSVAGASAILLSLLSVGPLTSTPKIASFDQIGDQLQHHDNVIGFPTSAREVRKTIWSSAVSSICDVSTTPPSTHVVVLGLLLFTMVYANPPQEISHWEQLAKLTDACDSNDSSSLFSLTTCLNKSVRQQWLLFLLFR